MLIALRVALAAIAILCLGSAAADDRTAVDVAIVFVADTSASISDDERMLERSGHAAALASAEVLEAIAEGPTGAIAAAYVEFGMHAWVRVEWTRIDGPASAKAFGEAIMASDVAGGAETGSTAIGAGLQFANALYDRLPYAADRLVVDVVGDGVSNDGPSVDEMRAALLARGATINGMPMPREAASAGVVDYYVTRVVGGPGHFNLPLTAISDMPMALRQKILLELY